MTAARRAVSIFFRRPATVAAAVRLAMRRHGELCPPEWERAQLFERAAAHLGLSEARFGAETAALLGLPFAASLVVPPCELVRCTGYPATDLADRLVVPQPTPSSSSRYVLVAAFPEQIDRRAFERAGVSVLLGAASSITAVWERYFERLEEPAEPARAPALGPSILSLLHRIATDCDAAGASEAFLGHPDEASFECMTPAGRFTGKIPPELAYALRALLESRQRLEVGRTNLDHAVEGNAFSSLELALTNSDERSVIFLGWDPRRAAPPRAERTAEPTPEYLAAKPAARGVPRRIAMIDDDERFSTLVAGMLRSRGHDIVRYHGAGDFLSALAGGLSEVALVLCDLHLTDGRGEDIVFALRVQPRPPAILVFTSDDAPDREAALITQGIDAFVRKDQPPEILLAWILNLLARRAGGGAS